MKKKMKQFLAAMMAVAMVLSLCVTAGAGSVNSADTISGGAFTPLASGDKVTTLGASNGVKGTSKSEGPLPEDPVEVIFPTIPAKASRGDRLSAHSGDTFGVFDIILDPHQLISVTSGERYKEDGIDKTFDAESRLYFLNSSTDKTRTYTGESRPLQITNKGLQPIAVDLSVDFTYNDAFVTLVDEKANLTMVSGDTLVDEGAQMYFALKVGTLSGDSTISGETVAIEDPSVVPTGQTPDYTPYITVSGKGNYLVGKDLDNDGNFQDGVDFDWTVSGDALKTAEGKLKDLSVKLTYVAPDSVMSGGDLQDGKIQVTVQPPTGYDATVSGGSVVSGDFVVATADGDDATVEISLKESSTQIATIEFDVKSPEASMKSGDNFAQTIQFKKRGTGVVVHQAIAGNKDAYKQQWVDPNGTDVDHDAQGITDNGYYWKLDKTVTEFPSLFFSLEGDINNDSTWDAVNVDNTGISFELIWDVMQKSDYYNAIDSVSTKATLPIVEPKGTAPTLSTVTKAASKRPNATIAWSAGSDEYSTYQPVSAVVTGTETAVEISNSGQTITVTGAYSNSAIPSGATLDITFADSTGNFIKTVVLTSAAVK